MKKSKLTLNIYGIRLSLNLFKNLISFFYLKILGSLYTGPFSAIQIFNFKNFKFDLGPKEVLVKTISCGFCGSDNKILTYDYSFFSSAFLDTKKIKSEFLYLGHEVFGKVVEVGKAVTKLKKNDYVTIDSMNRNFNFKKNKFGGWTNYFTKFEDQIVKLNKITNKEKSVFIEPLACCLQPLKKQDLKGKKILIIGLGTIGIGIASLIRFFYKNKVKIYAISKNQSDLKKIKNKNKIFDKLIISNDIIHGASNLLGAKPNTKFLNQNLTKGFDIIFDCSGSNKVIKNALRIIDQKAKLFLMSMNMKKIKFDPTPIWIKNTSIIGVHGYDLYFKKKNTLKFCENILLDKKFNHKNFSLLNFQFDSWKKFIKLNSKNKLKKVINFK